MSDDRKKPFKPARKPTGERKPWGERPPRDGEKPFRKPRGEEAAEGGKRSFGDRKPFAGRGERPDGERPSFRPRDDHSEGGRPAFKGRAASEGDRPRPRPAPTENVVDGERIAKRLARAGISSRRDAEALIADGRVRVNGVVLDSPARNVTAVDRIELDGKLIPEIERTRLFLFHKPGGVVTTNRDPEGRRTVFDVLPKDLPRLLTVGRLDINTEGLLLLTNDGGLARVLELPATGWLRRYRARVHGTVDEARLAELKNGIAVDGVFYGSIEATLDREQGSNAWLTLAFREGKNREVKNVLGALGLEVSRLIRISFGPFQLGELPEGGVQELKGRYLRDQLGDRLIEESGAVFDLPTRQSEGKPEPSEAPARRAEPINRRREREDKRSDALGRLDTRPRGFGGDKGGSRTGGKGKPEKREPEPPRSRNANVWMAPGARPMGKKKPEAAEDLFKPREGGPREGGRSERPARTRSAEDKPFRPAAGRSEGSSRPRFAKPRSEGAEGVAPRSRDESRPERKPFAKKPFGKPAGEGGAQSRRERPADGFADRKTAGSKPFSKEGRPARSGDDSRPPRGKPAGRPAGGGKPGGRPGGGSGGAGGPRGGAGRGPRKDRG